jgi:hypothetical protein
MKRTKYLLLFIGLSGIAAATFGLVKGDAFADHLMTIICGVSLIYGSIQLGKTQTIDN